MIDEGYLTGMMSAEIHTWGQKFKKKKERKGGLVKKEKPHMYLKQIIKKKMYMTCLKYNSRWHTHTPLQI